MIPLLTGRRLGLLPVQRNILRPQSLLKRVTPLQRVCMVLLLVLLMPFGFLIMFREGERQGRCSSGLNGFKGCLKGIRDFALPIPQGIL